VHPFQTRHQQGDEKTVPRSKYCIEEGCDCNKCESNELHICPCADADAQPIGFLKGDLNDFFEERAKQLAQALQNKMRHLQELGMPVESALIWSTNEIEQSPDQPRQRQFENQLDKCSQTKVAMCPNPSCFFHGICDVVNKRKGEQK
jgi:hypothetical protein